MKKIVIVGGGASGLACAIYASKNNKVILLEKNSDVGKKLLITGSGRCNYFNEDMNVIHYNSSSNLIDKIINDKNIEKIKKLFSTIGLIPNIKDGYYYPYSNTSTSVLNALKKEVVTRNVEIINDFNVTKITKDNKYHVFSETDEIVSDIVVLSTGSKSMPKTGSDGFGYEVLKQFDLNVIKPVPALVQLESNYSHQKKWSGIKVNAKLDLYENDIFIKSEKGELLLTDYGISGICTLNLSSYVSRGLIENKKYDIVINFVDVLNLESKASFINYLDERDKKLVGRNISDLFDSIINYKLVNILLGNYKDKKWSKLKREEKEKIAKTFYSFKLNITGTKSFDKSQVTSGGLDLNEININTMETKIKDLYVVGELLDVDGECGGYNLAFAFITGMIAGENIE